VVALKIKRTLPLLTYLLTYLSIAHRIRPFDMSCAQAHWVGSKPICRVMQLKLHKPTMAIGYSLRMCAQNDDSTNPGRSNLVFRSKPIAEAEMSNRLIENEISVYDLLPRCLLFPLAFTSATGQLYSAIINRILSPHKTSGYAQVSVCNWAFIYRLCGLSQPPRPHVFPIV